MPDQADGRRCLCMCAFRLPKQATAAPRVIYPFLEGLSVERRRYPGADVLVPGPSPVMALRDRLMSSFGHHNLPLCVGGRGGFFAKANARRAKSCQSTSFPFSSRECRYASTWHKMQPRLKNRGARIFMRASSSQPWGAVRVRRTDIRFGSGRVGWVDLPER